jgi:hypothetical protein
MEAREKRRHPSTPPWSRKEVLAMSFINSLYNSSCVRNAQKMRSARPA